MIFMVYARRESMTSEVDMSAFVRSGVVQSWYGAGHDLKSPDAYARPHSESNRSESQHRQRRNYGGRMRSD
jgi:hypothetical protein